MLKNYLILLLGIVGAAASVFFAKKSHIEGATFSAIRFLASATILAPFAWRAIRRSHRGPSWHDLLVGLPAALPLAVHYISWFVAVKQTSAAMSALIINLNPVLMPFLVWALLRERVNLGEVFGSIVAMAGVTILALSRDPSGQSSTRGILICCGSIALLALYLALGRKFGRGRDIFTYIVPLYYAAGVICLILAPLRGEPLPMIDGREALILIGAILVPTVIGHTALNHAMLHLPSQVVSIANLGQFVVVALLAMPILGEFPHWNLLLPAMLVVAGALIVIRSAKPRARRSIEDATVEPAGT